MTLFRIGLILTLITNLSCQMCVGNPNDKPSNIWQSFVKRLDGGYIESPIVDRLNPTPLNLITILWDGQRFEASGDYNNLGSKPVQVEGREIESHPGFVDFYPYATLEVSNSKSGNWKMIGTSPRQNEGKAISVLMKPNSLRDHPIPVRNRDCSIEVNAFRRFIGKIRYGRVVLRNGETSQPIVLTDLLPPKGAEQAHTSNSRN